MTTYKPSLFSLYLLCASLIGITFYWGFCWNWWGQVPILRYLFQPICPLASEESRYPQSTDVLVSARYSPGGATPSPGSEYLYYKTGHQENLTHNRYDFMSDIHQPLLISPIVTRNFRFITNEWILFENNSDIVSLEKKFSLYHIPTQRQISLDVNRLPDFFSGVIPTEILNTIAQGEHVYIMRGAILVLPAAIQDDSLPHHFFYWERYPNDRTDSDKLSRILDEHGIEHSNLDSNQSPEGRFYFRSSPATIYETSTNAVIVKSPLDAFASSGWAYRDQGLVLYSWTTECLIGGISIAVSTPCWFHIPHPILLLRQDPQYLPPDLQAHFAVQDALEARNKQQADIVMVALLLASVGAITFTIRARRRLARIERPVRPNADC